MRWLLVVCALSCLSCVHREQLTSRSVDRSLSAEQRAAIDAIAAELLEKGPAVGLSLAVAGDDFETYARGYGLANRELGVAASASTIYRIGSITKQFTAALVAKEAAQGRLGLD